MTIKKYDYKFFSPLFFVTIFGSGIRDSGSGMGKNQGSGIQDPQHCYPDLFDYPDADPLIKGMGIFIYFLTFILRLAGVSFVAVPAETVQGRRREG